MGKLKKAQEIVEEYFDQGNSGIYYTPNAESKNYYMETVYKDDEIEVQLNEAYHFMIVYGLDSWERNQMDRFYRDLCIERNDDYDYEYDEYLY